MGYHGEQNLAQNNLHGTYKWAKQITPTQNLQVSKGRRKGCTGRWQTSRRHSDENQKVRGAAHEEALQQKRTYDPKVSKAGVPKDKEAMEAECET